MWHLLDVSADVTAPCVSTSWYIEDVQPQNWESRRGQAAAVRALLDAGADVAVGLMTLVN